MQGGVRVPAEQASQHFAIVLDDELVSAPFINFQENPDGIDGSTGAQISGGFTITSAQDLAKILQIGGSPWLVGSPTFGPVAVTGVVIGFAPVGRTSHTLKSMLFG